MDASYDKEESFSKDEDLELELVEIVALKMGTLSLWVVGKFKAIAKAVGDRISFCVY